MSTSLLATSLVTSGSVATAVSLVGGALWRIIKPVLRRETETIVQTAVSTLEERMSARFDAADAQKKDIADKQHQMALDLATQFGGNGGGLREAINRVEVNLAELKGRVDQITKELPSGTKPTQ